MNFFYYRSAAKQALESRKPEARRLTLYHQLILFAVSVPLQLLLMRLDAAQSELTGLHAISGAGRFPLYSVLILVVSWIFSAVWDGAYERFSLRICRGEETSLRDMASVLRTGGQIILLYLLESVLIALWSMLFVFPGLIAAFRYRFAIDILLDNPEMTVFGAIRESSRMTSGYKMELFILELTFLPYHLLALLSQNLDVVLDYFGYAAADPRAFYLLGVALCIVVEVFFLPFVRCSLTQVYLASQERDRIQSQA